MVGVVGVVRFVAADSGGWRVRGTGEDLHVRPKLLKLTLGCA